MTHRVQDMSNKRKLPSSSEVPSDHFGVIMSPDGCVSIMVPPMTPGSEMPEPFLAMTEFAALWSEDAEFREAMTQCFRARFARDMGREFGERIGR